MPTQVLLSSKMLHLVRQVLRDPEVSGGDFIKSTPSVPGVLLISLLKVARKNNMIKHYLNIQCHDFQFR